jgi:hypothetical protein
MNTLKPVAFAVLGAVIATAAFGNVPPPPPPPGAGAAPAAWEYRTHEGFTNANDFNKLGAEGWELATSYIQNPNGPAIHTFKRRK